MRKLLIGLLVAVGVLAPIATSGASAPTTAADNGSHAIGIRLMDAPVSEQNDPRAHSYIIDHLPPGMTIKRRIEVSNTTALAAHISVYSAGATINKGLFIGSDAGQADELSRWTTVDKGSIDLRPGTMTTAAVTIAVPKNAAPGERYAVVWAQVRSAPDAKGVSAISRVGVRIYLSVGSGNAPATDFSVEQLTAQRAADGSALVVATVRNTGGRAVDLSGTLKLTGGPGGLTAGPFPATLGSTLAPGQSGPVTIALDSRIPNGPWQATLTMTSDLVTRTATATITFPDAGSAAPVAVDHGSSSGFSWIWIVLVIVLVLVVSVLVLLWTRARRNKDRPVERELAGV